MLDSRPDIVIIVCDDLGYGDLGCYGSSTIRTPRLDAIAAEGALFTAMYSAAPTCTPSRAGLLTGREAVHVGLPIVLRPGDPGHLSSGVPTIADLARAQGYRTACVGKWHLGGLPDHGPLGHGFDQYFGLPYSNDMEPLELWRDDRLVDTDADVATLTRRYTDEAIEFVDASDSPFLLYLAFAMPHHPVAPEPGFSGGSAGGAYGDVVEAIDHYVGALRDHLKGRGSWDRTVFVFTSDHGPRFEGSTGVLRGRKFDTFEGGMRVPFLLRWPGHIAPGALIDSPASCLDLLPSIADTLGWPREAADGELLSPLTDEQAERGAVFFYDGIELNAIRLGRWKLHRRRHTWGGADANAQVGLPQLFDVRDDPGESYDLRAARPDVVRRLTELIDQELARSMKRGQT